MVIYSEGMKKVMVSRMPLVSQIAEYFKDGGVNHVDIFMLIKFYVSKVNDYFKDGHKERHIHKFRRPVKILDS